MDKDTILAHYNKLKKKTNFKTEYSFKNILKELSIFDAEIKVVNVTRTINKDKTIQKFHKLFDSKVKNANKLLEQRILNLFKECELLDSVFKNFLSFQNNFADVYKNGWTIYMDSSKSIFFRKEYENPVPVSKAIINKDFIIYDEPIFYLKSINIDIINSNYFDRKIYLDSIYQPPNCTSNYFPNLGYNMCKGNITEKIDQGKEINFKKIAELLPIIEKNCLFMNLDSSFYKPSKEINFKQLKSDIWSLENLKEQ